MDLAIAHRTIQRHRNERYERDDYELLVTLTNKSEKTPRSWHIDVEIPSRLLQPHTTHGALIADRSNRKLSLLRMSEGARKEPLRPGDHVVMRIAYRVDDDLFDNHKDVFKQMIRAVAYVDGALVATASKTVEEVQNF